MGDNVENCLPNADYQFPGGALVLVSTQPRAHRKDQQIDTTADHAVSGSALAALRSAAGTGNVAFAQAAAAEWPNWWPPISAQFTPVFRAVYAALPG